jgi:hypothetical protein
MNNYLVPPSVVDIVEKLNSPFAHENEKMNYVMRLEATRDYCTEAIVKSSKPNPFAPIQRTSKANRR